MRRLSPYLILAFLLAAPLVAATLTAAYAGPLRQDGEPATPETDFGTFVVNIRLDLELLADEFNGPNVRPQGWNGNIDPTSPSILGDIWLDLEAQARLVFQEEVGEPEARPLEWIGAVSQSPVRIARNLRHDLELLADVVFGEGQRPTDWIGAPPIFSCSRSVQNLVDILERTFAFTPTTPESVVNYCGALAGEAQDLIAREDVALVQQLDVSQLLENIRGDLERLADELNGLGRRPEGWLGTISRDSTEMAEDLLTDIELLADQHFGEDNRPPDWIGELGTTPGIAVRNLRHDLELLADITLAGPERDYLGDTRRPYGWLGTEGFADELTFCDSATQSLILVLRRYYRYQVPPIEAPDAASFCSALEADANAYAETDPERATEEEIAGVVGATGRPVAVSDYAFAYLDVAALQYMGIMPRGVQFEAWYRNFGGSNMMYVVGDNFAVYISREWTTLPEDVFYRLPTLQGVIPETYCFAEWCAGPGPTPTPTGQVPTPTPGAAPGGPPPGGENLVLVPWNQVRIFYDQDRPESGTVLVRLDLCAAVNFGCEPVQTVYGPTGAPLPILNVIGPYPVFELPYGYSNQYILQSANFYANEIWVSDPTLRGIITPTPIPGLATQTPGP